MSTTAIRAGMRVVICLLVAILTLGATLELRAESREEEDLYTLAPGDRIFVNVFGVSDFDVESYVSNSGRVHIPHVGVMSVLGETTRSLASKVAKELIDRGLLSDPVVRINVTEYGARPVYALGEVMTPGQFMITEKMFLTDLIGQANGFNDVASTIGYLYRRKITDNRVAPEAETSDDYKAGPDEVITVDLEKLYAGEEPNIQLQGGDLFYVPERRIEYFYVIGDVNRPGRFEIPRSGSVFSVQALGMAGGPTKTAKLGKSTLVTRTTDGSVNFRSVNLEEIFKGKVEEDFTLQAGQIIYVPGSTTKSLGYGLLNAIPGMAVIR